LKNYKSLLPIVFLSIFTINVNAEVLIPSDEDKESLMVYLVKNPKVDDSIFTRDIDNNLAFEKNSYGLNDGVISSNACLLIDLSQIDYWDYLGQIYNENDANLYLVESIYTQYGINNLAKILSEQSEQSFIDFASSQGLELKVETFCKNSKNGNRSALLNKPDIFLIPNYLYNLLKGYEQYSDELMSSLTGDDVLISWSFDEMVTLSNDYLEVLAEEEKGENEFQEKIANLAEQKSKDFIGSLFLSLNDYGSPKFCTLNYSGDDAVAAIGYRLLGDEMIPNSALIDYYNKNEITLNHNENDYYFVNTFDDISEAFSSIKPKLANNEDYCNIFVDYPENLLRLKNAIERDLGGQRVLGNLFDKSTTDKQYALGQGFDDYQQYSFANQINANYREIKSLESYQIVNLSEFNNVEDEIVNIGYSSDTSLSIVLTYLDDLSNAQQKNMDVNEYRDARLKEEQRLAQIAREEEAERQAAFAREYPYTATFTCGMGGGDHINIVACFVGSGSYGVDTELEITNGQNYQMYKPYNLTQAGSEYYSGFEIDLRDSFTIKAQNSSENLVLSLKIVDNATGTTLYQDSAAEYGVIYVSN
jgi:hypothetical protein